MPFVRNVVRDLVEKRLWPVAVLLVAALVAVPVVIGRSGGDAGSTAPVAEAPAPAPAKDTASKAVVTLDTSTDAPRHMGGTLRDPFKAPKGKAEKATATSSTPTASSSTGATGGTTTAPPSTGSSGSSGSSGGSRGSGGSGSSGGSTKPKTTPKTTPKKSAPATPKAEDGQDTYHVSLRFGQTGHQESIRDIARLTPLPSVTSPFFVFLGVLDDGRTAVFMVSSDATPTGDGTCKPKVTHCEAIELKAGDTEYFDLTAPDGTVTQYQMDLVSVRRTEQPVGAAAVQYARHSSIGAELVRDGVVHKVPASDAAKAYRYLPRRGVLVRAKRRAQAKGAALVPGAAEALAPRAHQPGIPVWHAPAR